ncbi:MAG: hypothetical protein WD696_19160 [Bryobacteraceae bacterium]
MTPARRFTASHPQAATRTYVVCLDCGKEFRYDWQEMRIGDPVPVRTAPRPAAALSDTGMLP